MYDMRCQDCGDEWEIACSYEERADKRCPACYGPLTHVIRGCGLTGALPSKPITFGSMQFETNREFRNFMRENPRAREVSKSDSSFKNLHDRLSEKRESNAKKMGFGSISEQQAAWKNGVTQR